MYFDIILHYAVQKDRGKKEGDTLILADVPHGRVLTDVVIVSYFNSYLNSVHEYSHCEGVLCRKAPQCDLRDPGRGDPGFRHCWSMCFCCTPSFDLALFSFSCFFGCFLSKIG